MQPITKEHRAAVQARAEAQQAERTARGDTAQLERLDAMFGVDKGATKERVRLMRRVLDQRAAAKGKRP